MPDMPSKFQKQRDKQTDKQTKTGKNITSLAEVINAGDYFAMVFRATIRSLQWSCTVIRNLSLRWSFCSELRIRTWRMATLLSLRSS